MESFKCMDPKCGGTFQRPAGPTVCLRCGSIYVEWVNFENDWECNEENKWEWKRKSVVLDLTSDTNKV